jgi:histone H3/H4
MKAYVRISAVKEYVKFRVKGMRVAEDAIDEIDKRVEAMLTFALLQAVKDKRKTVLARDIAASLGLKLNNEG